MARIDNVRRECEDLGTWLSKYKRDPDFVKNPEAMEALAVIHKKAMSAEPEPTLLTQQLDEFRQMFHVPDSVAANYRIKE